MTITVLAPIELAPSEEPLVVPQMLLLLGLSCGGLALGMWARNQRTVWSPVPSVPASVADRAPRK